MTFNIWNQILSIQWLSEGYILTDISRHPRYLPCWFSAWPVLQPSSLFSCFWGLFSFSLVLSSWNTWSVGLRSGDWFGQSRTFHCLAIKNSNLDHCPDALLQKRATSPLLFTSYGCARPQHLIVSFHIQYAGLKWKIRGKSTSVLLLCDSSIHEHTCSLPWESKTDSSSGVELKRHISDGLFLLIFQSVIWWSNTTKVHVTVTRSQPVWHSYFKDN